MSCGIWESGFRRLAGVLTKRVHYVYGVFDHLIATEVDSTGSGTYNKIEHYVLDVQPEAPRAQRWEQRA